MMHSRHEIDQAVKLLFYRMVRAGLVARGTTLNGWCVANGVLRQTAEKALKFELNGPKAVLLRNRLAAAAGVSWPEAA